ncbi:MAG: hypothetical protein KGS72_00310 [Cyanobacteria bacterium REEB67]|nr:hypothetical protein [Cyanobacteria bacterium REEB67]
MTLAATVSGSSALLGCASMPALAQKHVYIADNGDGGDDSNGAQSGGTHKAPPQLECPGVVTYWMHDATGYHPCIIVALEAPDIKLDLTNQPINVQAQFRMLSTGILLKANKIVGFSVPNSKETIYATLYGKRPFELGINPDDWPVIECKVLAKVGDVSNDDAQTIGIYRVRNEAWSDEDALGQLNWKLGQSKRKKRDQKSGLASSSTNVSGNSGYSAPSVAPPRKVAEEKPLVAVAAALGAPLPKPATVLSQNYEQFLLKASLPGLGDDFYQFEKAFGQPLNTDVDNRDKDWVWVAYRKNPKVTIFAGSKGKTNKVDVVIASIDTDSNLSDSQFGNIARALSSKFKAEKMGAPEHSVSYTPAGRIELANMPAQSYRATYFTTVNADDNKLAIVAVSRQPRALSELLREEGQRTEILRFLLKGLGSQ